MIEFNECDVIVNGVGLAANSTSISEQNNLTPVYSVGYQGNRFIPSGPVVSNVDISYKLSPDTDPNTRVIEQIKSFPAIFDPCIIEIAGLECCGYLTSYSLKASPNNEIQASVSYTCFWPVSGILSEKRGTVEYESNYKNFAHAWTTFVSYGETGFLATYDVNYDFSVEFNPVYSIGDKKPKQIIFGGATERVKLIKESFTNVSFSGDFASKYVLSNSGASIRFLNFDSLSNTQRTNGLFLDMRSGTVLSSSINAEINQYANSEIVIERRF